jgi:hypothetical protein
MPYEPISCIKSAKSILHKKKNDDEKVLIFFLKFRSNNEM